MQRVPATVVTGFLGAGKTSLVRHLLGCAGGRRLAVIVNAFGELGIAFVARLRAAIGTNDALRVKGYVALPGRDRRQVVQAVGDGLQQHFDRPWHAGEKRQTRLVVIGRKGLDRAAITAALGG
jgi:G3E family GTPase